MFLKQVWTYCGMWIVKTDIINKQNIKVNYDHHNLHNLLMINNYNKLEIITKAIVEVVIGFEMLSSKAIDSFF